MQSQVDVRSKVTDILNLVSLLDHLCDCGEEVLELAFLLPADRLCTGLVSQLDEASQLATSVEAGPDQAVPDDSEAASVVNLTSPVYVIITIMNNLNLLM